MNIVTLMRLNFDKLMISQIRAAIRIRTIMPLSKIETRSILRNYCHTKWMQTALGLFSPIYRNLNFGFPKPRGRFFAPAHWRDARTRRARVDAKKRGRGKKAFGSQTPSRMCAQEELLRASLPSEKRPHPRALMLASLDCSRHAGSSVQDWLPSMTDDGSGGCATFSLICV